MPVAKPKRNKKWLLAAIPAFLIGLAIPTGGSSAAVSSAAPTSYVTVAVSGPTTVVTPPAKPGATKTVTQPVKTVTERAKPTIPKKTSPPEAPETKAPAPSKTTSLTSGRKTPCRPPRTTWRRWPSRAMV